MPSEPLLTERLRLDLIDLAAIDSVFQTMNDRHTAEIISFMSWPMTREQAESWCARSARGALSGEEFLYVAHDKATREPVGCISLHLQHVPEKAEIGYWVARTAQGQGFASEMLRAIIAHAFATTDVKCLYATTALDNPPSKRVLEKAGFIRNGETGVKLPDGCMRPSHLYERHR